MSIGITIHQHDWSEVDAWFERRAAEAGHSKYVHSEIVDVSYQFDPVVVSLVDGMTKRLVESLAEILKNS